MSYLSGFQTSPYTKADNSARSSPTLGKTNFRKFPLHHQYDNPSQKAENNLQKTLDLIHNRSPKAIDYSYRRSSLSKIDDNTHIYSPKRASERKGLMERDHAGSRSEFEDIRYENYLLKCSQSPSRMKRSFIEESRSEHIIGDNEALRQQVRELSRENETLKFEVGQVKAEYQRRYEDIKKSNDSLLLSYEERHKNSLQGAKENFENEINDLKSEISRLQSEVTRNEEMFKHQKEKLLTNNLRLEKEKQDLFLKVNQMTLANPRLSGYANESFASKEASNLFMDQVLKEKHELLGQYNDLFSSYTILLEHNKVLTEKLENVEKERDELSSHSTRKYDKKKKVQSRNDSPDRLKKNKDKAPISKLSKDSTRKVSMSTSNINSSSINQRTREMLIEELKDDITIFEDKLRASTGSLDGILNPKLTSDKKVPPFKKDGVQGYYLQGGLTSHDSKENRSTSINTRSQHHRSSSMAKSSKSKDKTRNNSSLFGSQDTPKEQPLAQSSLRSARKVLNTQKNHSNTTSPKGSHRLTSSANQSRSGLGELSSVRNNSVRGAKVPLYSKVKKL